MIMLDTGAGADSPVHVYQEIDSIDQSVGKGRFRSWSTDLGLDTILHPAFENLCCFQLSFRRNLGHWHLQAIGETQNLKMFKIRLTFGTLLV